MDVEAVMTNSPQRELSLSERALRLSRELTAQSGTLAESRDASSSSELIRLNRELLQKCDELLEEMGRVREKLRGR